MKKSVMLLCLLLVLALSLSACGGGTSSAQAAEKISFSQALDIASIEALEGKTVEIIGYMATISPLDGRYIYLMEHPVPAARSACRTRPSWPIPWPCSRLRASPLILRIGRFALRERLNWESIRTISDINTTTASWTPPMRKWT